MQAADLARYFQKKFDSKPRVFSAPGRVNLIGEHTDYNDGFVLPSAIDLYTQVAIAPRNDHNLIFHSENFPQEYEFDTNRLPSQRLGAWCDYVLGVAMVLRGSGIPIGGANLLVKGEVPIGAGLSSSAAIEVASALAFLSLSGTQISMPQVAKICQEAEGTFVGARVGIMDQFVSCLGKAGHALLLDCRSLEFRLIPIPNSVRLVICNTMVKRELVNGGYNRRREECEEGVRVLSRFYPEVRALRDVSLGELERHSAEVAANVYKRCLHVVRENQRVLQAAEYLERGNLAGISGLMRESHESLRDLYEVSCRELNIMVEIAEKLPGCCGARMTGGGFGGCTINLVNAANAESFAASIRDRYREVTGIQPDVYICSAANGAGVALESS